jgi:signal transduction histidine kinase
VPSTGLWLRVFVGLLVAVIPPILLLTGVLLLTDTVLQQADPNVTAVLIVVGAVVYAAVLAVPYTRSLNDDFRSLLELAQHGQGEPGAEAGSQYHQVAATLDERNRQVATLAREAGSIPIDEEPGSVVVALLATLRTITHDSTWRAAVLTSRDTALLPTGSYGADDDPRTPEPIGELERWASVSAGTDGARRVVGPWGAFAVVAWPSDDAITGIFYAPWEGRPELSAADTAMLRLVAQHAGSAVRHSVLYATVRSQAEELDRLTQVQSDFLRGVTHDLQTPLTSIGALATELRAGEGLSSQAHDDLATISHQAERLRRMVGQLLIASRLEAGAFTPRIEVFALHPVVERTWSALRADRPFEVKMVGPPSLGVADPDRAEQVLWALLDNAVKYSPAGSPIEVTIASEGQAIELTVRDEGAGMDEEAQHRAFDQFYRSEHARRLAPDGSGVGLYAARGLIEAMGGSISLESTLGSGSSVTVRLPAEPAHREE